MADIYIIANENGSFWNGTEFTNNFNEAEKYKSAPSAKKTLRMVGKTNRIFLIENFGFFNQRSFEWCKTYLERK